MCEKLLVEHHEGRRCRNFAKWEFWKVEYVIFSKTVRFLEPDITTEKQHFYFYGPFIFNIIFRKILGKKASE